MRALLRRLRERLRAPWFSRASQDYWTKVNVTAHRSFDSAEASLDYFHWRNAQYHDYIRLMPVTGADGRVVLDYGCGPGNDLVGFGVFSKPARLIAMDVAPTSLAEAQKRLALHGARADFLRIDENDARLPLDDASVDLVHSSGVLHHVPDAGRVLGEFRRVLRPGGEARIMVYHYASLWVHLYVAFVKQIDEGAYRGLPVREAFRRTTDGEYCPISNVYAPPEFLAIARGAGLEGELAGCSISRHEVNLLPRRTEAIACAALAEEHRAFLRAIEFDARGYPAVGGVTAGIGGCYRLRPR